MDARVKMARELSREEAQALFDTGWWEGMNQVEVARLQLGQDRLCMPFNDFHAAIEKAPWSSGLDA